MILLLTTNKLQKQTKFPNRPPWGFLHGRSPGSGTNVGRRSTGMWKLKSREDLPVQLVQVGTVLFCSARKLEVPDFIGSHFPQRELWKRLMVPEWTLGERRGYLDGSYAQVDKGENSRLC